jgi:hypothetical protein
MGCNACKQGEFTSRVEEITLDVKNYVSNFTRVESQALSQEIELTLEMLEAKIDEETVVVVSKRNDIKRVQREEQAKKAEEISVGARKKIADRESGKHLSFSQEGGILQLVRYQYTEN